MDSSPQSFEYGHHVIECMLNYLAKQRRIVDATKISLNTNATLSYFEKEAKALHQVWTQFNKLQPVSMDVTTIDAEKQRKMYVQQLRQLRHKPNQRPNGTSLGLHFQEHLRIQKEITSLSEVCHVSWQSLVSQSLRTDVRDINITFNDPLNYDTCFHLCIVKKRCDENINLSTRLYKFIGAKRIRININNTFIMGNTTTINIIELIRAIHILINSAKFA
jgi:hypothetical protein